MSALNSDEVRSGGAGNRSVRVFAVLVAVAGLFVATAVITLNGVGGRLSGILVEGGIANGDVQSAFAASMMTTPDPSPADIVKARAVARAALRSELLSVPAARALGLAAGHEGKLAEADRMFAYAERLSRRDLATELWLIESSVRKEDIRGALQRYDHVLRVYPNMYDTLFPTLRGATDSAEIRLELASTLREKPNWWLWFLRSLIVDPQVSPDAVYDLLRRLHLRAADADEQQPLGLGLSRLAEAGRFNEAVKLFAASGAPDAASATGLRNGGFERRPILPVFDWTLNDTPDLAGVLESVGNAGQGVGLRLIARRGSNGVVARQLMLLSPGRYIFSFVAAEAAASAESQPSIAIRCGESGGAALLTHTVNAITERPQRFALAFVVPEGCRAQWAEISAHSTPDSDYGNAWIDDVTVRRV